MTGDRENACRPGWTITFPSRSSPSIFSRRCSIPSSGSRRSGEVSVGRAEAPASAAMRVPPRPEYDIILVTGKPHADHPLSASGVIRRVLEAAGCSVGIIEHPDWATDADFRKLGAPRLYFRPHLRFDRQPARQHHAAETPPEKDRNAPYRSAMPDRAVLVYANKIRALFPGVPHRPRRDRGVAAALRPLRLLGKQSPPGFSSSIPGRTSSFTARREGRCRDRPAPERGERPAGVPGTCVVRRERPPGIHRASVRRGRRAVRRRRSPRPRRCFTSGRRWPRATATATSFNIPLRGRRRPISTSFTDCRIRGRSRPISPSSGWPSFRSRPIGLLRRLFLLFAGPAPGRSDRFPVRGIDPGRNPAPRPPSRLQGIH